MYLCIVKQLLSDITSRLSTAFPVSEARELALWILEESTSMTRSQILGCKDTKNIPDIEIILQRIIKKEPIQYIFSHSLWFGLDLTVNPSTLIPRPETAELVQQVLAQSPHTPLRVADIGTGSGCIAIKLQQLRPQWHVTGIDISAQALATAHLNARRNQVEVQWLLRDVFSDEIGSFDLIVSNPPYIRESEKSTMDSTVLDYEPHTALFVPDNDPLRFYRQIALLHRAPRLFFEIHEAMGPSLQQALPTWGYDQVQLLQDSYGKDRIIIATSTR